jgi:hypothetical protein|tara:strand:- start:59691 stop:60152 length:462 start_codon:yes stop_codon:yes gene_type:complete
MKLSEFKKALNNTPLQFTLEDGNMIPAHFHITEIGAISKKFIDCGGTLRNEEKISFQLWYSEDVDHRLTTEKLLKIIEIGEKQIGLTDDDIEVEYQNSTIGKFNLEKSDFGFILTNKQTACLAMDQCGIPVEKVKKSLSSLTENTCTPGGGCC